MRIGVVTLVGSIAANLVAIVALVFNPAAGRPVFRQWIQTSSQRAAARAKENARQHDMALAQAKITANRAAFQQSLVWSALKSEDLRELITRLRAAGFSPALIRAMITAKIDEGMGIRLKELSHTTEVAPYWKRAPQNNLKEIAARNEVSRERTQNLRALFDDPFFAGDDDEVQTDWQLRQYGSLPKSKRALIDRINVDYTEMERQVRAVMEQVTLPEDREKLQLLEREKQADLATVLTPQELDDYDQRNSPVTVVLRRALTLMDASEEEFHAIFELQQQLNEKFSGSDGSDFQARNEAELKMAEQLKDIIGETRAAEFARARDYGFQVLAQLAEHGNLSINYAVRAYDLRASTAAESVRILNDSTLNYDQQLVAMRNLADNAKTQLTAIFGPDAGAAYANTAIWIRAIGNGTAVQFHGAMTSFPSLRPRKQK